ncbi:Aldehyde/histidinol dehydrogenase [Amylocystis lapponica]|nr:Aldehyde/histidinol dehydrogenase [Amylocystis lapponica]
MSVPFTSLFINGKDCPASTGSTFEVRNPYSGDVVGTAASASSNDCIDAVEAAVRAFPAWEKTPLHVRRDIFLRASALLTTERYTEKLKAAMHDETAATDFWINFNIDMTITDLAHNAGLVTQLKGETFPSDVPGAQVVAQRRANGVIFAMAPWNAPVLLAVRAVAIPLLCGNTVVLKSTEVSPRTQAIVVELLHEAGIPAGVLNYISMAREDSPFRVPEIIAHPAVRKINFTGSARVGQIIAETAAKYLKPCILELGGKAPVIVLEDADVAHAARAIAFSALMHSGQICMSTERVVVQRGVADVLATALEEQFSKITAGGRGHSLSALFAHSSAANIVDMIAEAQEEGATVVVGDGMRDGAVVQPHIIRDVKPGMKLWERESFGPVVVLIEADTIDEAVDLANDSEYSLVAGLWTQNIHTALDVASRIHAGSTNINGPTVHVELQRSHGGLGGASGYGHFDIDHFSDVRMIIIHPEDARSYPMIG